MSVEIYDLVIVGAGHGGSATAVALRDLGFAGSIALVGAEALAPYDRPALSKDYLLGKRDAGSLLLRPHDYWASQTIDLYTGDAVIGIDMALKRVALASGRTLGWSRLVWAAGGAARGLTVPGSDLAGVHSIRDIADVDAISAQLEAVGQVVIIGGGFVGLEAAAALRGLGKAVTLVETQDRVLARVAAEPVSRFFEAAHRGRGVRIVTGRSVSHIEGRSGRASAVALDDGEALPADMILAGVGMEPRWSLLKTAGAQGTAGLDVDGSGRTSLDDVFGVGDCTAQADPSNAGGRIRIESVHNATAQARAVARELCGLEAEPMAPPWFWSNQYDLRLQTAGLSQGHDHVVVRGDPETAPFSVLYLRRGRVIALDSINSPADFMAGRKLVAAGATVDPAVLADPSRSLKGLITTMAEAQ